jgi:hypothetical protein
MARNKIKQKSPTKKISEKDRKLAGVCRNCPVCNYARKTQKGLVFAFVRNVENRFCPFCKAYERVYGRKAHQRIL